MNTDQITGNDTKENENLLKYNYDGLEYLLDLQSKEAILLGSKILDEVIIQRYWLIIWKSKIHCNKHCGLCIRI